MNLDELNGIHGTLFSDADKSSAFSGIVCGSNGAPMPEGAPRAFMAGYNAAIRWREEAEQYQQKKSDAGKSSAASRESRYGTSQPSVEHSSNNARTVFGDPSNQATSHKLQAYKEQTEQEQSAAPAPSSPEKANRNKSVMEREASLRERLVEVWNASCTQAKTNTRRCLPSCKMFPVGAAPSLRSYMKVYSDEEIIQLVTDGSFKVQRNDFYHERKYSLTNLMRNLDANASLPVPATDASNVMKVSIDLDDWLIPVDCTENEKEDSVHGRGTIIANDHDGWMKQ